VDLCPVHPYVLPAEIRDQGLSFMVKKEKQKKSNAYSSLLIFFKLLSSHEDSKVAQCNLKHVPTRNSE